MSTRFRMAQWGIAAAAAAVVFLGPGTAQAALDHYLCYTAAVAKGEPKLAKPFPVRSMRDQLEFRFYDAKKPIRHCNPALKDHNGVVTDIDNANLHLEGYQIALTAVDGVNVTVKQKELAGRYALVRDQFGEVAIKIIAPESVQVRASKTVLHRGAPVACSATKPCLTPGDTCLLTAGTCVSDQTFPAPPAGGVDNFKCYKVAMQPGIKFTKIVNAIKAQDQFGGVCTAGNLLALGKTMCDTDANCDSAPASGDGVCSPIAYDIVKPTRLCMPVDKNNEDPGAETNKDHLMCYGIVKSAANKPVFPKFLVADANGNYINDRLNVTALAKEICLPASKRLYYCGDGITDQPFEDCDAPKVCQNNHAIPCKAAADCPGSTCVPNTFQCSNQVACSKTCQCPLLGGLQPYHVSDFSMNLNINSNTIGKLAFVLNSSTAGSGGATTFNLNVGAPDAAGIRTLNMDDATWVFDSFALSITDPLPIDLSIRLCAGSDMTGTLHTKSGADNDYTSSTNNGGTTYSVGDGKKDKPGSALTDVILRADIYIGAYTCTGDGIDHGDPFQNCVGCDNTTLQPVGRIGILEWVAPTPDISIPLPLKLTTQNDENTVNQAGNALDGSEVLGHGYLVTGQSLRLSAANAKLQIDSGNAVVGIIDAQFIAAEGFSPACPPGTVLGTTCLPDF